MDTLTGFDNLGKRLKLLLKDAGYTQARARDELDLSQNAITNYVQGRTPEAKTLYKLAKLLGVTMEYLLTGEEKTKDLSEEENQLIQTYRTLNEKQQEKASCYLARITNRVDGLDNRLKLLLDNTGYTQAQVTDELNLSQNTISTYVNGKIPEARTLYQLSKFFEVSMEWFLTGEVKIKDLSEEENQFIQRYRMLNLKEQGKIIGYMDGIVEVEN